MFDIILNQSGGICFIAYECEIKTLTYVPVLSAEPYGVPSKRPQGRKGADPCHVEARAHYPVVREVSPPALLFAKGHAVSRQRLGELPVEVNAGLVFVSLVVE